MARSTAQQKCFIIMPITTPPDWLAKYNNDADHFTHVLEHLFMPAVKEAGFEPVPPKAQGSNLIHADIIKQLRECELVLCDMSVFNPNVFFECGIRTALDKPVALVVDDKTKPIPFDIRIVNFREYDSSLATWTLDEQRQKLTKHVQDAYEKSKDHNALWKYFGVTQTGSFKPEQADVDDRRTLSVLVHRASFIGGGPDQYYFVNVTNLSKSRDVEITHVWFETDPQVHVMQPKRPLPKRLKPDESWETWIPVTALPIKDEKRVFTLGRVRLSNDVVVKSKKRRHVPSAGFTAGP